MPVSELIGEFLHKLVLTDFAFDMSFLKKTRVSSKPGLPDYANEWVNTEHRVFQGWVRYIFSLSLSG